MIVLLLPLLPPLLQPLLLLHHLHTFQHSSLETNPCVHWFDPQANQVQDFDQLVPILRRHFSLKIKYIKKVNHYHNNVSRLKSNLIIISRIKFIYCLITNITRCKRCWQCVLRWLNSFIVFNRPCATATFLWIPCRRCRKWIIFAIISYFKNLKKKWNIWNVNETAFILEELKSSPEFELNHTRYKVSRNSISSLGDRFEFLFFGLCELWNHWFFHPFLD